MKKNYFVAIKLIAFVLMSLNISQFRAQNGVIGSGFGQNNWSNTDCMSDGAGGTRAITLQANGTGFQYFRMVTCWDGNFNQWGPSSTVDDYLVGNGVIVPGSEVVQNSTSKAYYIDVASTTDNYVFKTRSGGNPPGAPTLLVMNVNGAIRSVTNVAQSPSVPNQFQNVTVTATLDGALVSGQSAYLRYTTDGYTTSTIIEMTGSGTTYTANIPAQVETTSVSYYVFSSLSGASIAQADADLYTINLNNNGGSNYNYTVVASGLPVELTAFNASCQANFTTLTWTTASEDNASHFDVEMSRDGMIWNNIGRVEAAGTTSQTSNYQFSTNNSGALTYFRLVQIDFDGASEIYGPISSVCDINKNTLVVSPNPASETFKLEIRSTEAVEKAIIQIVDMMGTVVWEQASAIQQGSNNLMMQANRLSAGTYIIRVQSDNSHFESIRIMVK